MAHSNRTSEITSPPAGPTVTAYSTDLQSGQSVALSTLFSATDSNGTIADYYFFDANGGIQLNGATNLAPHSAQAAGYIEVSAADLSKLTYTAGTKPTDTLYVIATDASSASLPAAATVTISGTPAPATIMVTAVPTTMQSGQSVALSALFTATETGGTITDYLFFDPGHRIQLNGATNLVKSEGNTIEVSAADLAKLTYVAGHDASEKIYVTATDGTVQSQTVEEIVTVTAGSSHPAITLAPVAATLTAGQSVALSTLFTAAETDGTITDYLIYDPGHRIQLNGATNLVTSNEPNSSNIEVSASDLAKLTFLAGGDPSETIYIAATDGTVQSKTITETVTVTGVPAITVTPVAATLAAGQSVAVSTLFTAAETGGTITDYLIYDPGHHIQLNGATNLVTSNEPNSSAIEVSAADLAKLTFVAGDDRSETLYIAATDGSVQSRTVTETVAVTGGAAPPSIAITAVATTLNVGQSAALSTLFTAAETGGTITAYYFYDANDAIQLNGATNLAPTAAQARGYVEVSAADLAKLTLTAGHTTPDVIYITATDGTISQSISERITIVGATTTHDAGHFTG